MFKWFRSKQDGPRELSFDVIADIVEKYGVLLETYPIVYVDESLLPAPKDEMRRVLRAAWKIATDLRVRNAIEVGWASLHRFQPNVGSTPITPDPAPPPNMLDRFVDISKVAKHEMNRDFEELQAFRRAHNPT